MDDGHTIGAAAGAREMRNDAGRGDDASSRPRYRFGGFEYDAASGELIGPEGPVEIAPTPSALLELLLDRRGEVVSRATAWTEIWPERVYDLDQKLNYAVHQLRRALSDNAAEPRFVQTLPRRGYRWVAPVEVLRGAADAGPTVEGGEVEDSIAGGGVLPDVALETGAVRGVREAIARPRLALLVATAAVIALIAVGEFSLTSRGSIEPVHPSFGPGEYSPEPAAFEAFQIGTHLLERGEEGDAAMAESYFWTAVDADGDYASPWVGLAAVREDSGDRRMARVLLERAIALDPAHAEAHAVLGRLALEERRWAAAKEHLSAAAENDPTDSGAHHQLAHRAAMLGDFEGAVEHIEEAMRIDPGAAVAQGDAGWIYYWAGDPRRAIAECSRHETIGGPSPLARACLLSAYLSMGDVQKASVIAIEEMEAAGVGAEGTLQAPEETLERFFRWRLEELERLGASQYARARVAAMMGDHEAALAYLERSTGSDEPSVRYALAEPVFRPLHDTSGFDRVRDRLAQPSGRFASR